MAVREDEDVAQAMGINLVATKLMAFATGAGFSALSGAIFATKIGSVYPHSFNVIVSINIICLIIVGGMGSILWGPLPWWVCPNCCGNSPSSGCLYTVRPWWP
jgi:ABC-type branched-subunit amino acid transport system permease subunit